MHRLYIPYRLSEWHCRRQVGRTLRSILHGDDHHQIPIAGLADRGFVQQGFYNAARWACAVSLSVQGVAETS
jgi:hypothetical protein